jgi:hypothetical protein
MVDREELVEMEEVARTVQMTRMIDPSLQHNLHLHKPEF